jgi:hypothetical protein
MTRTAIPACSHHLPSSPAQRDIGVGNAEMESRTTESNAMKSSGISSRTIASRTNASSTESQKLNYPSPT